MECLIVRHLMWRSAVVVLVAMLAGCGGSDTTSPSGNTVTETFSGTLSYSGSKTHTFTANAGGFTVTVSSISPTSVTYLGLAIGTYSGNTCTLAATNDFAGVGGGLQSSVKTAGTMMCVKVYDSGYVTSSSSANYTIAVVHY